MGDRGISDIDYQRAMLKMKLQEQGRIQDDPASEDEHVIRLMHKLLGGLIAQNGGKPLKVSAPEMHLYRTESIVVSKDERDQCYVIQTLDNPNAAKQQEASE